MLLLSRQNLKNQKGFTLIESLLATALFAAAVMSIVNVYLTTVRINRRTDLIRTASENARFVSEYLSKEIRNGQIDYLGSAPSPCTSSLTAVSYFLPLVNVDGDRICLYLGDDSGLLSATGTNLWLAKNNLTAVKVNSSAVTLRLAFKISPTSNPYAASLGTQPRVSVVGEVHSISGTADNISIPFETSISIPVYDLP